MRKRIKRGYRNKKDNKVYLITLRYLILLGVMFSLPLIYSIFTPLTVYPVYFSLKIVYHDVSLLNGSDNTNNLILIGPDTRVEIISACVAGSAYLLLLILNLTVSMDLKKRIYSILLSFLILLVFNILRIFIFSIMYHSSAPFFDFTHKLFWYVISTIFVVAIWFMIVKIYRLKDIPVYTDFKYFYKQIRH